MRCVAAAGANIAADDEAGAGHTPGVCWGLAWGVRAVKVAATPASASARVEVQVPHDVALCRSPPPPAECQRAADLAQRRVTTAVEPSAGATSEV